MQTHRTCRECSVLKPVELFYSGENRCKECRRAASKKWYAANKKQHYARVAAARQRRREQDPDEYREWMSRWRKKNPERARSIAALRRARQRDQADGFVDYERILERDGFYCYLCGTAVKPEAVHFDHVIPLARGGRHAEDNIRVSHGTCNQRKGAAILAEHVEHPELYEHLTYPEIRPKLELTHCPNGHPYEGDNLVLNKHGHKVCRTCVNERARERKRREGAIPWAERRAAQTHCANGHEFTDANTYWYERDGKRYRYCRVCARERARLKRR